MNTKAVSYYKLKKEGKIKKMQDYIFNIIKLYNSAGQQLSARDISKITGLPINSVTGRINELLKKKYIKIGGTKYDSETCRTVNYYIIRKAQCIICNLIIAEKELTENCGKLKCCPNCNHGPYTWNQVINYENKLKTIKRRV